MAVRGLVPCDVCGNEIDITAVRCPYCGSNHKPDRMKRGRAGFRVTNLEKGRPLVAEAVTRMNNEIAAATLQNEQVLVLIHGYGSSGKGGAIRKEIRRQLQFKLDRKEINDFLPGEKGDRRSGHYRLLLRRFPFIADLLKRPNPGITLVVL